MKLTRNLCFLDIESDSLDPQTAKILELGVLVWDGEQVVTERVRRFNPGRPIPAESTAVHHITDADVANEPPFSAAIGKGLLALLVGCDLGGYNLRRLDLPLLDEELRRVGLRLDLTGVLIIDAYGIFAKKEGRTLSDAVRKYCGREHDGAHGAGADNAATLSVLQGQLAAYPDLAAMDIAELAKFSTLGEFEVVDLAGKLHRDADGFVCYSFGKSKGVRIVDDPGFADWMLSKDFSGSTKDAILAEFERIDNLEFERDPGLTLTGQGGVEDVAETGAPMVDMRGWRQMEKG